MNIIPAIDIMDNQVVRLVRGDPNYKTVYSNDPIEIAKKWEKAGADMLHIVDLDATLGRGSNIQIIKKIPQFVSIPVEVAGGLRTKEMIENALQFASRVVLGTIAFKSKQTLEEISKKFGNERIVISTDQLNGQIVISGWKETTKIGLIQGIKDFVNLGYSQFLITTVERDGTLQGPDLNSLENACNMKSIKVIASGGISNPQDIINLKKCGVNAIILGKALYDGKISIEEAKALA